MLSVGTYIALIATLTNSSTSYTAYGWHGNPNVGSSCRNDMMLFEPGTLAHGANPICCSCMADE